MVPSISLENQVFYNAPPTGGQPRSQSPRPRHEGVQVALCTGQEPPRQGGPPAPSPVKVISDGECRFDAASLRVDEAFQLVPPGLQLDRDAGTSKTSNPACGGGSGMASRDNQRYEPLPVPAACRGLAFESAQDDSEEAEPRRPQTVASPSPSPPPLEVDSTHVRRHAQLGQQQTAPENFPAAPATLSPRPLPGLTDAMVQDVQASQRNIPSEAKEACSRDAGGAMLPAVEGSALRLEDGSHPEGRLTGVSLGDKRRGRQPGAKWKRPVADTGAILRRKRRRVSPRQDEIDTEDSGSEWDGRPLKRRTRTTQEPTRATAAGGDTSKFETENRGRWPRVDQDSVHALFAKFAELMFERADVTSALVNGVMVFQLRFKQDTYCSVHKDHVLSNSDTIHKPTLHSFCNGAGDPKDKRREPYNETIESRSRPTSQNESNNLSPLMSEDDQTEYEVQEILGFRKRGRGGQVCVRWAHFADPTWEPLKRFLGTEALLDYEKEHGQISG
ncbi:hypothetical protein DHEL01_v211419 [Diaporthe helianthi]|uniref:Chromo domain-containing protein n=1 Tax=Diaporthe helianthi TaxID=158607 RepID=A0A2P5HIX6_DIAHE|nr:hypothetical protein DHEL01_v211419 [Diaporthe helianthi]